MICTYNVRMNKINTTLTTSGNSIAVRLPKEVLKMSGLGKNITLEVSEGQIVIRKANNPREGWAEQITKLNARYGDPTEEFKDLGVHMADHADNTPWNGVSFEDWQKSCE